jgi:hypothetical protein
MPRNSADADRLLLLTLMLEPAIEAEDWPQITELLRARASILEDILAFPNEIYSRVVRADERMLAMLQQRLVGVRSDMRNLSAALKIAAPYARESSSPSLSLAG